MGVIVFLVWSGSGEIDFWFVVGEVIEQMVVNELSAVVAVEAFEFKREFGFDVLDLFDNAGGAVIPSSSGFGPTGVDVGEGQTPYEIAGQRVTAVSDGIGLHESGL